VRPGPDQAWQRGSLPCLKLFEFFQSSPPSSFLHIFLAQCPIRCYDLVISNITHVLQAIDRGDPTAADELLPLVYGELRKLAAKKMAKETPGQTLQPTALVHEAWLRVAGHENQRWDGRGHFFAAAAEAMRRILIDKARRKRTVRHGGGQHRVELEDSAIASPTDEDQLLAVNDALDKLAARNKFEAELVKLRYFVGMTLEESAKVLGISARTADNYWAHARAWLFDELKANGSLPND